MYMNFFFGGGGGEDEKKKITRTHFSHAGLLILVRDGRLSRLHTNIIWSYL